MTRQLRWGDDNMMELGNIYSGALLAWLAAGLEEAALAEEEWEDREILLIGYGSGDAAEALPLRVRPGWRRGRQAYSFLGIAGGPRTTCARTNTRRCTRDFRSTIFPRHQAFA